MSQMERIEKHGEIETIAVPINVPIIEEESEREDREQDCSDRRDRNLRHFSASSPLGENPHRGHHRCSNEDGMHRGKNQVTGVRAENLAVLASQHVSSVPAAVVSLAQERIKERTGRKRTRGIQGARQVTTPIKTMAISRSVANREQGRIRAAA